MTDNIINHEDAMDVLRETMADWGPDWSEFNWELAFDKITAAISEGIASKTVTPLPGGAHLKVLEDGRWRKGAAVVALVLETGYRPAVITERGDRILLGESRTLAMPKAVARNA